MVKISKYIYIHPLTIFMFAAAYITHALEGMVGLYVVMLIHELSHTVAAVYLQLGVSRIILYPFGVCLTVNARILCSLSDKIILYFSGPLIHALIAAVLGLLKVYNDFYYNNLMLFILNLLPILPLDGGKLLEEIILSVKGEKYARRIMLFISVVFSIAIVAVLTIYVKPTFNSLSFVIFIIGGVLLQKPKYNRDYIRQLSLTNKKSGRAKVIVANYGDAPEKFIKDFSPNDRTIVVFCKENGEVESIQTDQEVIYNTLS